ncbi:MAG TPA: 16S rRNA (cytidine(1402)-2'-O)-methyltransferase [Gemmatimonadaceae bacterium]|nr:16S rRNA (cytidine(1402)-2'-O)-methyltransferase [Gemmatimonadaceae bacterium]
MTHAPGAGGVLYVVSTPIGNLGDMTLRAIETLKSVAVILAEDTRHSRKLLDHFDIGTPLLAYHEHNEAKSTPALVARLGRGESMAIITDAGTPLLSDPGSRLVSAAIDAGVRIVPIPGASALLAALVTAGLPAERFTFFGFLERKGKDREREIGELRRLPHTAVLYESPNRLAATLVELTESGLAERRAVVGRELTKQFEELTRGTVAELARYYENVPPRGEVVVVIESAGETSLGEDAFRARARELRASGASARDVVAALMDEMGAPRNLAYKLAHEG